MDLRIERGSWEAADAYPDYQTRRYLTMRSLQNGLPPPILEKPHVWFYLSTGRGTKHPKRGQSGLKLDNWPACTYVSLANPTL